MYNRPLRRAIVILAQVIEYPLQEKDITTVCMHCDKLLKGPKSRQHLSHGICNECMEKYYPEVVYQDQDESAVA